MHAARANQVLYGGAMGGGKSHAIRWDLYGICLQNPGCFAVLVRQALPQLYTNHIMAAMREIPEEIATFNQQRKALEFKNGSALLFRHCDIDQDLNDFQGMEIHALGIDEASLLKPEHLIYIRARVRLGSFKPEQKFADGTYILPRILLGANPGGLSHQLLKRTFIDPAPAETVFHDKTTADPRDPNSKGFRTVYIPATMRDNKYIDAAYAGQFTLMRDDLVRMYRDGDWDVIPGAFFDCWDRSIHVVKDFNPPEHWTRFRSLDWGHATPFSVGWWCVSDGETPVTFRGGEQRLFPVGALIRYKEYYGAAVDPVTNLPMPNKGLRLSPKDVAAEIKRRSKGEKIAYSVADSSMWEVRTGPSAAEQMARAGVPLRKADRKRNTGWAEMYARLKDEMMFICEGCTDFVRTVPGLHADPNDAEDIEKRGQEDHCFAAGTLVETADGPVAVECLPKRGRVFSPGGVKRYRSARLTRKNAPVVRLTFEGGRQIVCTSDHKFLTENGWIPAIDLIGENRYVCMSDMEFRACESRLSRKPSRSLPVGGIIAAAITSSAGVCGFTGSFGRRLMDRFLTAGTSTTRTETAPTTRPTILSVYRPISIWAAGMARSLAGALERRWLRLAKPLAHGTVPMPVLSGTNGSTSAIAPRHFGERTVSSASSAARTTRAGRRTASAATSASPPGAAPAGSMTRRGLASPAVKSSASTSTARPKAARGNAPPSNRPRSVAECLKIEDAGRADVYCLTVPETAAFCIEGGLIVHNCADETRYAGMSRPMVTAKPDTPVDPFVPRRKTFNEVLAENTKRRRAYG